MAWPLMDGTWDGPYSTPSMAKRLFFGTWAVPFVALGVCPGYNWSKRCTGCPMHVGLFFCIRLRMKWIHINSWATNLVPQKNDKKYRAFDQVRGEWYKAELQMIKEVLGEWYFTLILFHWLHYKLTYGESDEFVTLGLDRDCKELLALNVNPSGLSDTNAKVNPPKGSQMIWAGFRLIDSITYPAPIANTRGWCLNRLGPSPGQTILHSSKPFYTLVFLSSPSLY